MIASYPSRRSATVVFFVLGLSIWVIESSGQEISPAQAKFFETKIRPVLVRECFSCHSEQAGRSEAGLRLDTKILMELGGNSGPAIAPRELENSLLWNAINHVDFEMPPGKQLNDRILKDFETWIEMGAPDPRKTKIEKVQSTVTNDDIKNGRKFWSFIKPQRPEIPEIENNSWPRGQIDSFIASRLELEGLAPAEDADPSTFLRRITTDLTGLPPSPEQVKWFIPEWNINPDSAIGLLVDKLLASERFGERWGRHWLDVARYAESTGRELNATIPNAWRYRDYVIDAFNNDKPYDEFIQEQIAGDMLPAKNDEQWSEQLVATGFLALGPKTLTETNARQFNLDVVDEQIDVTTRVILGVSVACARCHDHKFDPIQQKDYYAMAGIFESTSTHYGTINTSQNRRPSNQLILPVSDPNPFDSSLSTESISSLKNELAKSQKELQSLIRERRTARKPGSEKRDVAVNNAALNRATTRIAVLESKLDGVDDNGNPTSFCVGVQDKNRPADARLLVRGEFDQPDETVRRGFVQVLCKRQPKIRQDSSGRLELAKWLTDKNNPLTARVMANRIWLHLLGNGIVASPEDFGATGSPPTHPQLLDCLAVEFMENGWSAKDMIRKIVTSRTYRMSSTFNSENYERDSDNLFYWRANPKQLDAESLRDAMLFVSGELETDRPRASVVAEAGMSVVRDGKIASFRLADLMESTTGMQTNDSIGMGRRRNLNLIGIDRMQNFRSIYLPIVRDNLPRALEVFDFAEPGMVVGQRETSNTPAQGLYLMNNEFVVQQSKLMAQRLIDAADSPPERIQLAFLNAYGREATDTELESALIFYRGFDAQKPRARRRRNAQPRESIELQKLSALTHAIFASAEFRYLN